MDPGSLPQGFDRRVPVSVILPQFVAPFVVAGDVEAARLIFLFAVGANIPISLAGRLFDPDLGGSRQLDLSGLIEWARPIAAWLYAGLLVSLLPFSDGALHEALTVGGVTSVVVGVSMYVVPGCSTPAGVRLQQRLAADSAWRHEAECFFLGRASRVLPPCALLALVGGMRFLALTLVLVASGSALMAATLRPRNASGYESHRSEKESAF